MSTPMRGRKRSDLSNNDNHENDDGNKWYRDLNINEESEQKKKKKRRGKKDNKQPGQNNPVVQKGRIQRPDVPPIPTKKELETMPLANLKTNILDWSEKLKNFVKRSSGPESHPNDLQVLFSCFTNLLNGIIRISLEDMQSCQNMDLGDRLHDLMLQEITVIHNEIARVDSDSQLTLLASTLDYQFQLINNFKNALTDQFDINFNESLLRIVMMCETPKTNYPRYLLQITLILLSHIVIERRKSDDSTVVSFLNLCHNVHPGLGRYRFYIGGMKVLEKSFLDAVYYYMSSIDCKIPYDSREQLKNTFDQSFQFQYKLEQDKRKGIVVDSYSLRVYVLRFIRAVKCIWTNIDLDKFPEYSRSLGTSLNTLISQWSNQDVRLSSKTLIRIMSITLMTIENCLNDNSHPEAFNRAVQLFENGKTKMVFISDRDIKGTRVYASLCLLYTVLASLCESYSQCMSLRNQLLPAIALGFHYLFMKENIFRYSMKANEFDIMLITFVQQCAPFFRLFDTFNVVGFPTDFESCNIDRLSEEYSDILGNRSLDFIVSSSLSTLEYSNCHTDEECAMAVRGSFIRYTVDLLVELGLLEHRHSKVYAVTEACDLPQDTAMTELHLAATPSAEEQIQEEANSVVGSDSAGDDSPDSYSSSNSESGSEAEVLSEPKPNPTSRKNSRGRRSKNAKPFGNRRRTQESSTLNAETYASIKAKNRMNIDPRLSIILDACNIAMHHGGDQFFSTRGIYIARDYFKSLGLNVIGFVPRYYVNPKRDDRKTVPKGENIALLQQLVDEKVIFLLNPRDYDDTYALDYAINYQGILVSNDLFRDFIANKIKENPQVGDFIQSHLLSYVFVNDVFMPNPNFVCPDYFADDMN